MRPFRTAFPSDFLSGYQAGVLHYSYKGVRCLKSPIDIAIYMRCLWALKPRTILEIGSHSGGGALLLADLAAMLGLEAGVVSIDLKRPEGVEDERIRFLEGDVGELGAVMARHGLEALPHPWFVTEDSAHSYLGCSIALATLAELMEPGDLLAMEDGVLEDLGIAERYDGGPNRAIREFFETRPGVFEVDTGLCDMFGQNATYNPNGYLRKL